MNEKFIILLYYKKRDVNSNGTAIRQQEGGRKIFVIVNDLNMVGLRLENTKERC